jgi:hypothetical protein
MITTPGVELAQPKDTPRRAGGTIDEDAAPVFEEVFGACTLGGVPFALPGGEITLPLQ